MFRKEQSIFLSVSRLLQPFDQPGSNYNKSEYKLSSVPQSCPILCDPMHTRPPCPSLTPRVYPNSCPLSQWCHPTILFSGIPFSSCPQSFPASGLFKWISSSHQVAKVLEFQLQHQSFQWTCRTDLLAVQGTLKSLLQHHSSKESTLLRSVRNWTC